MAQLLRSCTPLGEDPSLVPSTHIWQLITSYNSSSRIIDTSGLHQHPDSNVQIHTHISTTTNLKNPSKIFLKEQMFKYLRISAGKIA